MDMYKVPAIPISASTELYSLRRQVTFILNFMFTFPIYVCTLLLATGMSTGNV